MFEDITPEALAAEVLFLRAQAPESSIVLLEGDSDVRLFENLLDVDISNFVNCFGKENVLLTIEMVDEGGLRGVLAIVDADFAAILGTVYASQNVVQSDFHDFEVVLFNSTALDRLLTEDGSREKIKKVQETNSVREVLINSCLHLGCLRLYSQKTASNLKFKGMRYRFLGRKLEVQIDEIIKEVFDHSRKHTGHDDAKKFINNFSFSTVDPNQLVCGHDLIAALGVALQSLIGSRNAVHCAAPELESKLRLGFSREEFSKTRTYADIRAWEHRTVPFRVLH
ncbi:DUF4435 domain-containing protein [Bradyrhizobium canariense]|uniref:DUF4435 domain-containing protein n=1 Tax=Bradyrhizobium canariense TaxID=255045 RepID=UPI000A18EC42|nr:DUF4435 domain-containing protein [Bradyrhizobium canariense]OSI28006.1 hypothetical protein BST65_10605 [Bradyrhizobium canariense]OSI32126.1 hypothetical protein BST66_17680 [Bradyrhizobium canariense]OSI41913.1 hypothetical protein BSZ20_19160 [Bradyrhizobium canariense]OSI47382.1 hypothetical protein BST67_20995 [Bradyrhizobium canariense]OSI58240.1 hypothetical protein BSZ15_10335 [Bradyrhizobium canariense]